MAIVKCPSCEREISDSSSYCPFCGTSLKRRPKENETESKPKSFVIGYRGGPGGIKPLAIVEFVIGVVFSLIAIALIIIGFMNQENGEIFAPILVSSLFFVFIGVLGLVGGGVTFYRMDLNSKLTDPCLAYDAEKDRIILCTIKNEKISIGILDYIELKDNAFTDNLLYFTYRTGEGKSKKVNLGYCSNREDLRPTLNRLRDKKYGL